MKTGNQGISACLAKVTVALLLLTSAPAVAGCQSYRGWAGTSIQLIELRPFGLDSVPRSDVLTDARGSFLFGGYEVTCVFADICTGYVPLPQDRTIAASQDLSLTFGASASRD